MRILVFLVAIALALMSCAEDSGSEPDRTQESDAPLTNDELLSHLLDVSGCGSPVEKNEYARDGLDMYFCGYGRAVIYIMETRSEMDAFIASAPCQPDINYVRGDRWYLTSREDALAARVLSDGAERASCG